ncbi:MAG: hypothetical protein H6712_04950 [Myxococcales bacterium]|nr:hypothetical protein [Myxococcales bacterium]MCB9713179.1 hypothetical protein [Myxococcales bacterium]
MAITEELYRLGNSSRRLNAGSDQLNRLIERIDQLLSTLMIGLDYVHPRPVDETTSLDHNGKRVIELSYVGYLRVQRSYHLAIKTVKVLESKLSVTTQTPGEIMPLLTAPRRLRYAAVDVLEELVHGLAEQVDAMVGSLERRCLAAESLVRNLEEVATVSPTAMPSDSGRRVIAPDDAMPRRGGTVVPGEAQPQDPGQSSGQWVMPASMSHASAPMPEEVRRSRTIAMGSGEYKTPGSE